MVNYKEMQTIIIEEYTKNKKSISKLSQEYPMSYRSINQLLKDNGITIRGGRKKKILSPEQLNELKEKFYNGVTYNELANYFQLNQETLRHMVEENNFKRRNNNRINKRIKSDYFSIIDSQEKAYWLGFLFTDGSVDHYGYTGRIRLQLQAIDGEILERFKKCLNLDCKIINDIRKNSYCQSVEFTDEQIFNDLCKYGIVPNKTYNCEHIPYELISREYWPAYARGLFDGDGSLTYSKDFSTDVTINFTSYYESTVQDFQKLINILINKKEENKNFFTSAWHTQWRGRLQALKILDTLYKGSTIHLKRKYDKYIALKNSLN